MSSSSNDISHMLNPKKPTTIRGRRPEKWLKLKKYPAAFHYKYITCFLRWKAKQTDAAWTAGSPYT